MKRILLALALCAGELGAQRVEYTIDTDWRYHAGGLNLAEKPATPDADWEHVTLPHTWNAKDPFDDAPSYRRGIGWYRKHLAIPDSLKGKQITLLFEGVNQVADVFVNNAFVDRHKGGYTAFSVDITPYLKWGSGADNVIAVQVNNAHDPFIPPLSVGYALYGGIYRDVRLIAVDSAAHFVTRPGASPAIVATHVTRDSARVEIDIGVQASPARQHRLEVLEAVLDAHGVVVSEQRYSIVSRNPPKYPPIRNPHLWSPDDPYLYTARAELYEDGVLRDRISTPIGLRWFSFSADSGFALNGHKLVLHGTNRHQDLAGVGSAMSNDQHVRDMRIIKDMGANFVRMAHYPQAPAVLDAADSLGLLVWEEIPVVNYITVAPEFTANAVAMMGEMIAQNRNHPSVIMWGLMNEVFLWAPGGYRIPRQTDTAYMHKALELAKRLQGVAREDDPSRYTTMAIHGSADYDTSGVANVSDVLALNLYNGWYNGTFAEFGPILDRRHARMPSRPIFVSEYGAEDDYRVNALEPERFDFSDTWMRRYHESYLAQINARPWLAGTAIWNEFDFSQPETGGTIPYMNQKGMATWDRKPKDVYYLYKANWNPAPMAYIASRGWTRRIATDIAPQPVDVYANLASVELVVNGKSLGSAAPDSVKRATWNVAFTPGDNVVIARGTTAGRPIADTLHIAFRYQPLKLADTSVAFRELGVNAGSKAQVADSAGLWIGDREYTPGSFGHVGGTATMFDKDLPITHTSETPLYFTYQKGLSAYRLDVPDGEYDIELLLAEPDAKPGERVFGISANGKKIADALDLSAKYGIAHAATLAARVRASAGKGITVQFTPVKGVPILNAIHVRRR